MGPTPGWVTDRFAPRRCNAWSVTGGRLVKHARCYWLPLAESHLTRRLFGAIIGKIAALPVATG